MIIRCNWRSNPMLREILFSELAKWSLEFKGVKQGDEVLICVSPDTETTRYSALIARAS